jgi:hypothetical protein
MSKGVYLTPSKLAILLFGGVRPLARAIGTKPNTVCVWQTRGDGGIPRQKQLLILEAAKKRGVQLTADDLTFGRHLPAKEIAKKREELGVDVRIKT